MSGSDRRAWMVTQVVGGVAVLGSYAWAAMAHPEKMPGLWGSLPAWAITPYTACMPLAAVGWLTLSWVLLRRFPVDDPRWAGVLRATLAVLVASSLWMPLCVAVLGGAVGWLWLVQVDLLVTAGGSLALLVHLARWTPRPRGWLAAVVGASAFCVQTVLLDALIWPRFFPV